MCISIWDDDINIENLSKYIITNNYNKFKKYKL